MKRQPSAGRRPPRGPGGAESPRNSATASNNAAAAAAAAAGVRPINCGESTTVSSRAPGTTRRVAGSSSSSSNNSIICGESSGGAKSDGMHGARVERLTKTCGDGGRGGGSEEGTGALRGMAAPREAFERIWEVDAAEALSARERGLLPDEHPVRNAFLEVGDISASCCICLDGMWDGGMDGCIDGRDEGLI